MSDFWDDHDSIPVTQAKGKNSFWDDSDSFSPDMAPAVDKTPMIQRVLQDTGKSIAAVPGDVMAFADTAGRSVPVASALVDKAATATAAGLKTVAPSWLGGNDQTFSENYDRMQSADRAAQAQQEQDHPVATVAGNVAGAAMLPIPGAGMKGFAGAATRMAGSAGMAAADQAAQADLASPGDIVDRAKKGGLLGGGIAAGMEAISPLAGKTLGQYAERRAVKAAGAMTKEMRDLKNAGFLQDTGRELLDQKIVTPWASLDDVSERAAAAKKEAGKDIGAAVGKVDDLVSSAEQMIDNGQLFAGASPSQKQAAKDYLRQNFQFNMSNVADRIESELIAPHARNPFLRGEREKLQSLADEFRGLEIVPAAEGLGIKTSKRRTTNFNSDTIPQEFKQDLYAIVKDELQSTVEKTARLENGVNALSDMDRAASSPEDFQQRISGMKAEGSNIGQDFADANRQYAIMANTEKFADRSAGRLQASRENSLSDTLMEGFGLVHGGAPLAIAMGVANKGVRRWGAGMGAVGADNLSSLIQKVQGTKYGPILQQAQQRGTAAMAAAHYILMQQDPQYQQMMQQDQK